MDQNQAARKAVTRVVERGRFTNEMRDLLGKAVTTEPSQSANSEPSKLFIEAERIHKGQRYTLKSVQLLEKLLALDKTEA